MATNPTRRTAAKLAATALASAPALAQSIDNDIRMAIIGIGGRGSGLLTAAAKSPGVTVAAICDIDPEALSRAAMIAEADSPDKVTSWRELLTRDDIDAIYIATPVDMHREMAVAALDAGKHVYLEKPMGRDEEEVRDVFQAAERAKGKLQLGFQLRYDLHRAAAVNHIQEGRIGRVAYMQGNRHTGDLPRDKGWLFDADRSGNSIVEQAVHILDLMNWAVQDHPIRVMGSGGINVWKNRPDGRTTYDNYVCIYEYPNGVRLTFTHLFIDPRGFTGISEKVWGSEWAIDLPSATKHRLHEERGKPPESIALVPEGTERPNSTQAAVDGFFEMLRGRAPHINTPIYGKWATLMAIMGRKAIDERRTVEWSEVDLG